MSSPPRGAVPTRIIRRKIEGRSFAICCAIMPPREKPRTSHSARLSPSRKANDVRGHSGYRLRHLAARAPDSRIVEEDDLPSGRERIAHGRIPVVERPREVLQAEQRQP